MRLRLKYFLILFTVICVGFGVWYERKRYEWQKTIPVSPLIDNSNVPGFLEHVEVEFGYRKIKDRVEGARSRRAKELTNLNSYRNLERVMHIEPELLDALAEELKEIESGIVRNETLNREQAIAEVLIRRHERAGFDWAVRRLQTTDLSLRDQEHLLWLMSLAPHAWSETNETVIDLVRKTMCSESFLSIAAARLAHQWDLRQLAPEMKNLALNFKWTFPGESSRYSVELANLDCWAFLAEWDSTIENYHEFLTWFSEMKREEKSGRFLVALAEVVSVFMNSQSTEVRALAKSFATGNKLAEIIDERMLQRDRFDAVKIACGKFCQDHFTDIERSHFETAYNHIEFSWRTPGWRAHGWETVGESKAKSIRYLLRQFGYLKKLGPYNYRDEYVGSLEGLLLLRTRRFQPIWCYADHRKGSKTMSLVLEDSIYHFPLVSVASAPRESPRSMHCQLVDIINHILERRGESRRMVSVSGERSFAVLFGPPEMLLDLKSDFGMVYSRGCDEYLKHGLK